MTKHPFEPPEGQYFEDYETGQVFVSPARTITETDVVNFAGLSGDYSSIHTDAVYAAQHMLGKRVAHGLLGLSIAVGLCIRLGLLEGTLLAFREMGQWKFSQPLFIGDTIHVRLIVTDLKPVHRLGGGMVTLRAEIINQEETVVQHGAWSVLVKSKPAA